jgi:asparagine synthase (glutamine-hydrolysing)
VTSASDVASTSEPIRALPLRRLERAVGIVFGHDPAADAAPLDGAPAEAAVTPVEALSEVIRGALLREPCVVSFSGGRDSSAVLALATAVAREAGLAEPVPVTLRFAGVESTEESGWQQLVIDHLGLREWEIVTVGEELDLLGPIARRTLRTHGLLWPVNAYVHVPVFERAQGGSALTGFDGDGLFGGWRWARAQQVLGGHARPVLRDARRVALACAPAPVRAPFMRPALAHGAPWLRPVGRLRLTLTARLEAAFEPRRWDDRVAYYARWRLLRVAAHSLDAIAAAHDAVAVNPLLAPRFLAALARAGGGSGFADRGTAMSALFGGLLPPAVIDRSTKAEFGAAIWRTGARAFARAWDGTGVDRELVDEGRLRAAWQATSPLFGSATLLHAAWLNSQEK